MTHVPRVSSTPAKQFVSSPVTASVIRISTHETGQSVDIHDSVAVDSCHANNHKGLHNVTSHGQNGTSRSRRRLSPTSASSEPVRAFLSLASRVSPVLRSARTASDAALRWSTVMPRRSGAALRVSASPAAVRRPSPPPRRRGPSPRASRGVRLSAACSSTRRRSRRRARRPRWHRRWGCHAGDSTGP